MEKGTNEKRYGAKTLEVRTRDFNIKQMTMEGFYKNATMGKSGSLTIRHWATMYSLRNIVKNMQRLCIATDGS